MERALALAALEREVGRVSDAGGAGPDRPVPTCPDWTLDGLLGHLGNVYAMVATALEGDPDQSLDRGRVPRRPPERAGLDWMAERFESLLPLLQEVPEDARRWNFLDGPSSPVAFWWRRQVHEMLIHRVDAELAAGVPLAPAEPALAADGVAELLELTRHRQVPWDGIRLGEGLTVHLHATDAGPDAEWTVDVEQHAFATAHLKADVAVRGPAWALDRWCWRRDVPGDHEELEIFGDRAAAEAWRPVI